MKRRAPAGGYDFGNKRQYRRDIWSIFAREARKRTSQELQWRDLHWMLMPSLEGHEISQALAKGVPQANLHCVDDNPAIVATLKRRYPEIRTYGVDVVRAAQRIAKSGVTLAGANLDLTGPTGRKTWDVVRGVVQSRCMMDPGFVAVTVLRGREESQLHRLYSKMGRLVDWDASRIVRRNHGVTLNPSDVGRIMFLQHALADDDNIAWPFTGLAYRSGALTMLVMVFYVARRFGGIVADAIASPDLRDTLQFWNARLAPIYRYIETGVVVDE